MLDKIFKVFMGGPTLRSPMPHAVIVGAVFLRFETSRVVLLYFWTFHPGLTLDGFEDVLDREVQWGEAAIHLVSSDWALLRVREWSLLESTLTAILLVDRGVSVLRLWFAPSLPRLKDGLAELFIAYYNWIFGLGTGPCFNG